MSNLTDKAKNKIDAAADSAKTATGKVTDKARDIAHSTGKKMEDGAKKLKDA
jgi:uncharacterized protein YjbJ (UPF0337 family)